ncbi:MAG: hypothetical protein PHG61_03325 [Candidatus Marinimicrobia bacterium]|jgi:hypothetical protein|nr:hypothetical protein [Candidatus Neomarinimicrobiota bacterium]
MLENLNRLVSFDATNRRSYISVIVAATSYVLWTLSLGKRAFVRKLVWCNRTGGNGMLRIGYLTLGAVFVQCSPDILMLNGVDGNLTEAQLPPWGNSAEGGFIADTTLVTGTLGNIIVQCSVGGAAPADVQVSAEIEEL